MSSLRPSPPAGALVAALAGWTALAGSALAGPALAQEPDPQQFARQQPSQYVGAEACGECHVNEYAVWRKTPHATGFKTLHRKESAEEIAKRMGFRLIKRDSLCVRCHYTPTEQGGQLRARSGVSCESCHGAGRDWIDIHNDYGGKGTTAATETAEHRAQRIERSVAAGMRRPSRLYQVARSCYGCHLVPEEDLVNVGGHGTGSGNFELVEWSQGPIRHNFLEAMRGGDDTNRERSLERKREMYVVGKAVELESALRGVAAATKKGVYLKAMQRRVRVALGAVREIAAATELGGIDEIVRSLRGIKADLGNGERLLAAADEIASKTERLAEGLDGATLASLDPLLLGTGDLELAEDLEEAAEPAAAAGDAPAAATAPAEATAEPTAAGDSAAAAADRTPATPRTATTRAAPAARRPAPKRRIRPRSQHAVLGSACSKCHAPQNEWWFDDPHYSSVEPFFDQAAKNVQIARLYGIKPSQMTRGDQICMDCHGTVVTGRERREVLDGVGCESCHGGAKDYLEPHQEGDKALGKNRPGYQNALRLGMTELQDLTVRARTCTGCHYITDARLLSAGHPSGQGKDWVRAQSEIRHWQHAVAPAAAIQQAFGQVLASRGAVPDVPRPAFAEEASAATAADVASPDLAAAAGESAPTGTAPAAAGTVAEVGAAGRPAATPGAPTPSSPGPTPVPGAESVGAAAPPEPVGPSVDEILLMIKERLERLYRSARPPR